MTGSAIHDLLLARGPQTNAEIAERLGVSIAEADKAIASAVRAGLVAGAVNWSATRWHAVVNGKMVP